MWVTKKKLKNNRKTYKLKKGSASKVKKITNSLMLSKSIYFFNSIQPIFRTAAGRSRKRKKTINTHNLVYKNKRIKKITAPITSLPTNFIINT